MITFNNGLGALPVSLFIKIKEEIDIFKTWDRIQEYSCFDIIFYGEIENIKNNIMELNFINNNLISNMYHVSIILNELDDDSILKTLSVSRIVVKFNSNVGNATYFKKRVEFLQNLTNKDIVILAPTSLKEFAFIRQYFITKKINAKIMIEIPNGNIKPIDLVNNKIYDIYLYRRIVDVQT